MSEYALVGDGPVARALRAPGFVAAGLGSIDRWPPALRWATQLLIDTTPAAALLCGPRRALLYNDAAAALLAGRHPAALGRPLADLWPDLPHDVGQLLARVTAGSPTGVASTQIMALRADGLAEVTLAVSLAPVRADAGTIVGLFATAVEMAAKPVAARAVAAAPVPVPSKPIAAPPVATPRLTVLVVEDDLLVLDAVTTQLADAGHHVVAAASSEEAVATLAAHAVDVLLTDLNLPGASGATLAATARRLRPEVGVVLATGDAQGATRVAVPHRLLPKPFTAAELKAALVDFAPLPPPEPTVWITASSD